MFQIVDTQFPDLPIILQASESQSLVIRYLPTDIGNHHATLRITDNMDDNPHLVEISGVGIPLSNTDGQSPELTTRLLGNYPNPFNPVTSIRYSLKERGPVTLEIYNLKGQMVRRLENSVKSAGEHSVAWDGKDAHGSELGSGVYFYKLSS